MYKKYYIRASTCEMHSIIFIFLHRALAVFVAEQSCTSSRPAQIAWGVVTSRRSGLS